MLPPSTSWDWAKKAFASSSGGMKFSRYGEPFLTRLNSTFCCGSVISFVLNRLSAGKAPVVLNQAACRSGVCMNMMKSAATSGYFVHAVMPTVCEVEPSLPAYGPLPHLGIAITPTFATPTCLTNFFTSEPAVTVIAAFPSDHRCWPW